MTTSTQRNSTTGAPKHIREWWAGTGLTSALLRAVELGYSWEEAHSRLAQMHARWFDGGCRGISPLVRLAARAQLAKAISAYRTGAPFHRHVMDGVQHVSVNVGGRRWSGYFPEARAA